MNVSFVGWSLVAWSLDQADSLSLSLSPSQNRHDESRLTVGSWHVQLVSGAQSKDRRVYIEPTSLSVHAAGPQSSHHDSVEDAI